MCALLLGAVVTPVRMPAAWNYPPTKTVEQTDLYHGTPVSDPFRWLEDVDSAETAAWVQAQNRVTFDFLGTLKHREPLRQRLTELYDYARHGLPVKEAGRYYFTYNTGLQKQSPLYVKDRLDGEARLVLDPNTWSEDGTVSMTQWAVSPDGRWLGYGVSTAGSDWNEYRVLDLETGRETGDVVRWIKFSTLQWTEDSRGFFYSRYPAPVPGENQVFSALANHSVYYHRLGTPQSEDVLIFADPEHPRRNWYSSVTDDGRYLFIYGAEGTDPRNRLYYLDLRDPQRPDLTGPVVRLIDRIEADYTVLGNRGSVVFLRTDLDAPRRRIIAIDLAAPDRANWRTVVPEGPEVIESSAFVGGRFVLDYLRDAHSRLVVFALDGTFEREIPLPGLGTVNGGPRGDPDDPELFFSYTSFVQPTIPFRHDLATGKTEPVDQPRAKFDPSVYETRQVFYTSKDGTRVPMFITHRRGLRLDGSHPAHLYAYGGFNVSQTPGFSPGIVAWLELGGVYALANLRGGGEYGREWHLAAIKERRQNAFDDFIAAGEYLAREGYTSPERLTISGGSNGGLLVGAVVNQRPDLARVALPAVGVMDMLRFHKFTIGWAWTSDYGSSDDPEGFRYLSAYSPVHNVRPGVTYPAILTTTADHDDRVHPGHSFKYAAALQAANPNPKFPAYIRIDVRAGHGAGRPVTKVIEETADRLAFALHFTGSGAN